MKIATYNVNGIRSRLPNLMQWLEREAPDESPTWITLAV